MLALPGALGWLISSFHDSFSEVERAGNDNRERCRVKREEC
jgi:hypothetical protein